MSGQVTRVRKGGASVPTPREPTDRGVDVRLLGPLEVLVDGTPADLGGRRPRALLALLALAEGRVVPLEQLVDDLWGGEPPASGVGTLQAYVSTLRRALGDRDREAPVLRWRDPGYLLAVDPDRIDAVRFERAVAEARRTADLTERERLLRDALAMWRGPVLADLADEPFVAAVAARLDGLRVSALEELAEASLAAGGGADLVTTLEAAVADNPLRERLAGCLVHALYRAGRQADALAAYDRIRRALADELGIDPSPALTTLHQHVLRQDPALEPAGTADVRRPAARPADRRMPPALAAPSLARFVGRAPELEWLRRQWERDDVRLAVLVGEPGIGKTRLATQFARERYDAGARVLWGRAPRDPLTPYQPFVDALRPEVADDPEAALAVAGAAATMLARLFPELRAEGDAASEPDRWLLFEGVASLVSGRAPVLLVLDDVQWLDASTASLLAHLARRPTRGRLLIVATQRADEEAPGPIATVLADLRRDRLVETLPVGGLDEVDAVALVTSLGGAHAQDLSRRAGGNPFFLEELVRAGDVGVPDSVRDVLTERLRRLEDDAVRVLSAAAVLGDEVDTDLLAPTSGVDELRIVDVLDAAIRAHLLVDLPEGRVGFAHALTRQTLLDGLTGPRRTALHRAAAAAVEQLRAGGSGLGEHLAEIANHLVTAGSPADRDRAVWFLHQAAERDLQRLGYAEAADACRRALHILDQRPDSTARLPVLLTLGRALTASGELGAARAAYDEAATLARDLGRPDDYATAALGVGELAAGIGFEFGLVDEELVALLEDALRAQPAGAHPARAMLAARLAVACYNDEDPARRDGHAATAVAEAEQAAVPPVLVAALAARHTALWRPDGDLDERLAVAERACAEADALGDPTLRLLAITAILPDLLEAGLLTEFDRWCEDFALLAAATRSPQWQWLVDVADAGRLLWRGRYDEGRAGAESAFHAAGGAQGRNPPQTHTMQMFLHARDLGRLPDHLALARERCAAHPGVPTLRAQLAAALAAVGDDAAHDELDAVLARLAEPGSRDFLWLATACLAADVAHALARADAADGLYDALRPFAGRLAPLGGAGVVAVVDRSLGRLAATAGRWPDALGHARAASARAQALDGPAETALALADLAVALRRTGEAGAVEAFERARAIAAPLGIALPDAFLAES